MPICQTTVSLPHSPHTVSVCLSRSPHKALMFTSLSRPFNFPVQFTDAPKLILSVTPTSRLRPSWLVIIFSQILKENKSTEYFLSWNITNKKIIISVQSLSVTQDTHIPLGCHISSDLNCSWIDTKLKIKRESLYTLLSSDHKYIKLNVHRSIRLVHVWLAVTIALQLACLPLYLSSPTPFSGTFEQHPWWISKYDGDTVNDRGSWYQYWIVLMLVVLLNRTVLISGWGRPESKRDYTECDTHPLYTHTACPPTTWKYLRYNLCNVRHAPLLLLTLWHIQLSILRKIVLRAYRQQWQSNYNPFLFIWQKYTDILQRNMALNARFSYLSVFIGCRQGPIHHFFIFYEVKVDQVYVIWPYTFHIPYRPISDFYLLKNYITALHLIKIC